MIETQPIKLESEHLRKRIFGTCIIFWLPGQTSRCHCISKISGPPTPYYSSFLFPRHRVPATRGLLAFATRSKGTLLGLLGYTIAFATTPPSFFRSALGLSTSARQDLEADSHGPSGWRRDRVQFHCWLPGRAYIRLRPPCCSLPSAPLAFTDK